MRDLSNLCVKVLHYELQNRSYLRFVHPTEPLDEVVDGCSLRKVAEKGRHGQPCVLEHPGPAHSCRVRSRPPGTCSSSSCCYLAFDCKLLFRWLARVLGIFVHMLSSMGPFSSIWLTDLHHSSSGNLRRRLAHIQLAGDHVGDEAGAVLLEQLDLTAYASGNGGSEMLLVSWSKSIGDLATCSYGFDGKAVVQSVRSLPSKGGYEVGLMPR